MADSPIDDGTRRRFLSPVLAVDEFRPMSALVTADIAARSHRGRVHPHNEDHYLALQLGRSQHVLATSLPESEVTRGFSESGYAMVIADGVGGTGAGAVASRLALATLAHMAVHYGRWNVRVDGQTAGEIIERAEWFYRRINEAVIQRARGDDILAGMSTTLTAAYSAGDDLFVAHVGRSRAYVFRGGELSRLTIDEPAGADRDTDDLSQILTETIGGGPRLHVHVEHARIWDGDSVLLCTDGLTQCVSEDRIAEVLMLRRRPDEHCQMLIDLALDEGGPDNVTVLLAQYRVPPP